MMWYDASNICNREAENNGKHSLEVTNVAKSILISQTWKLLYVPTFIGQKTFSKRLYIFVGVERVAEWVEWLIYLF